ncbi:casein kinase I [Friedmanniomyces endolithicus]|nr:casein kinase I [Friedmanniomyces endolithicus]KAK0904002.1 casein kinase I [Friedmanniomyces endolithicus]KAK0957414.1 casein kinase I [Friedmanniomyces endolithicus]KAK1026625.1 casein kinase I [Friedmanniomyces endolithicus]
MEKKMATSAEQLCDELPEEFAQYMQELKDIPAGVRPHYEELRQKFRRLAVREGVRNRMSGILARRGGWYGRWVTMHFVRNPHFYSNMSFLVFNRSRCNARSCQGGAKYSTLTTRRKKNVISEVDSLKVLCKGKSFATKVSCCRRQRTGNQASTEQDGAGLDSYSNGDAELQQAEHRSKIEHRGASEQDGVKNQRSIGNGKFLETHSTAGQEYPEDMQDGQSAIGSGDQVQATSTLIDTTLGGLASSLPDLFGAHAKVILHCPSSDYPSAIIGMGMKWMGGP